MKYTLMLLAIVLVFFGMHYYVFHRVLGFFATNSRVWLWALSFAVIFPLSAMLDRLLHSTATVFFYYISSVWMGILFYAVCLLLLLEIANIFYPLFEKQFVGLGLISAVVLLTIFSMVNATRLTVKEVEIDNFGKDLRIVQLSDVHIGTIRNDEYLQKIVDKTNNLNPDMVLFTGDFFDGSGKLNTSVLLPLKNLKAPAYMIMGNHEFYEGENRVADLMRTTNVTVLRNNAAIIKGVQIAGLDYSEDKTYAAKHLAKMNLNPSLPAIVLNHVPIGYLDAKNAGARLQLSGHTHSGQIFPFTYVVRAAFPKDKGLYTFDGFSLYVSQGVGTWGPPMRLGTKSEITLLKLKK